MKKQAGIMLMALCVIFALSSKSQISKVSERTKKAIDSTYNALIKKYKVVGMSLAIVDNGEVVYANGYGFCDREAKKPATEKTIYRIGSCTKSFTSLSILQLHAQKQIDIQASVKKYLPDLKITSRFNDGNEIFINDMLCHVSGLPCDIMNGFFCDAPPTLSWEIEELNRQTTISPRRYKHAYSNVAFGLLGEVIARKSGGSYSDYVKKAIFKPLEMNASFIDYDATLAVDFSKAYVNNKRISEPLIRDQAAGLIHSNVLDMANYLKMFLNKGSFNNQQVLSPELIAEMQKNQISDIYLPSAESWGYGLYSSKALVKNGTDSSVVTITGHGGDTYAFHADFAFINELGLGVVLLTNTDNGIRINNSNRLLKLYMKEEKGKKLNADYKDQSAPKASKDIACTAAEKKGSYNFGDFVMRVKGVKKIKFKQGPATVILKQTKADSNAYTIKARLFGIIPFKLKGQEFKFVKRDGDIYAKVHFTKSGSEDYLCVKTATVPPSQKWKNAFGSYMAVNKIYDCTGCPFTNAKGMKLKLSSAGGVLKCSTKATSPDMTGSTYLNVISDELAVSGGIGRGTGETVRLLENGNIYYSGFEFKKEK